MLAFLMWLFRFWTWLKVGFISLARLRMPPLDPGTAGTSVGLEVLSSEDGHDESELAAFLFSLPDVTKFEYKYDEDGFHLETWVRSGGGDESRVFSGDEAAHREFLAAVASSKVGCCGEFIIHVSGEDAWQYLEEIVGALKSNTSFKDVRLTFGDCSGIRFSECVSNMLLQNNTVQTLSIYGRADNSEAIGKEAAEHLAKALQGNRALQSLDLGRIYGGVDEEGMRVLVEPLKGPHSILQSLRVRFRSDEGLEHVGVMLATNTSLKQLSILDSRNEVRMRGYTSLRDALLINRTLEELTCVVKSSMELKLLLEPLMPTNSMPQANFTLTSLLLYINSTIGGKKGMDVLVDMIRTNSSLLAVQFPGMRELRYDRGAVENVVAILEALKTNKSLKKVGFASCKGVSGYKVLGTMMDMLLHNQHLTDIDLKETPLESSGDAEYVHFALEKRKKVELWNLVQGMAKEDPKSGRVFLCGEPLAGKTTLCTAMKRLPEFQKNEKGKQADMESERTHGIEVVYVECEGIGISIWDMAGQTNYHSFHDMVIPNLSADGSCTLFLLTCNPIGKESNNIRNIFDIEIEIQYWLRFIVSNTRRSYLYRPHVSIVMTHFDKWSHDKLVQKSIEEVVKKLNNQFEELLEFDEGGKFFKVNGLSEYASDGKMVFGFTKTHFKQLLRRLPKTIKACLQIQECVKKWNLANGIRVLKFEEFSNNICKGVDEFNNANQELVERKKAFVATSLHDGGHIMFHEEEGFVITDPHWFCHDIMGEFLHRCEGIKPQLEKLKNGMIRIDYVKNNIMTEIMKDYGHEHLLDELWSMMKKLHIFYEKDAENIMVPSTLQNDISSLKWSSSHGSLECTFIGRRLACKDELRTMFSPGFFTRLQVHFFNKFQNDKHVENSYVLSQGVIRFIFNRIEVIIELKMVHIDILLKSNESQDKVLEFLENDIVITIKELLSNPILGCPAIILMEYILRPECVQLLVGYEYRIDQYVSFIELEMAVVRSGCETSYNWKKNDKLGTGFDDVKDLLGDKVWKDLLRRRYMDLERFHEKIIHSIPLQDSTVPREGSNLTVKVSLLQQLEGTIENVSRYPRAWLLQDVLLKQEKMDEKLDNIHGDVNNGVNKLAKKLDVVINQLPQLQESIKTLECNLVHEVSSRIDDLMGFSVTMQESEFPKLAYLDKRGKKNRFIPGLMVYQLYFLCECRDKFHKVPNQKGCKVKFGTKDAKTFLTILWWALKISCISAKIGAHIAGGMGALIPDFGQALQLAGLVMDTSSVSDIITIPPICLESLPDDVKKSATITIEDRSKAQEWMIGFLKSKLEKGSSIHGMFGLRKVVYKPVACSKPLVAWVCKECYKKGKEDRLFYNN